MRRLFGGGRYNGLFSGLCRRLFDRGCMLFFRLSRCGHNWSGRRGHRLYRFLNFLNRRNNGLFSGLCRHLFDRGCMLFFRLSRCGHNWSGRRGHRLYWFLNFLKSRMGNNGSALCGSLCRLFFPKVA